MSAAADSFSRCLNLGCGDRFHPAWTNLDFVSRSPAVRAHDLRRGIPSPDASFDVVYHSHVLEHFAAAEGRLLLRECFRTLRPGGILRVAVPDLERIARAYLQSVDEAGGGDGDAALRHEWMILELYDQAARHEPGGESAVFLRGKGARLGRFLEERMGAFARGLVGPAPSWTPPPPRGPAWLRPLYRFLRYPAVRRAALLRAVLGGEYRALAVGRFRLEGEIHLHMYDRLSLGRALAACGFEGIVPRGARESAIPGWEAFHLDADPDGTTYKADSLFMEARRPA